MTESHPFNNRNFYGHEDRRRGDGPRGARPRCSTCGARYMNVYGAQRCDYCAPIAVIMRMLDSIDAESRSSSIRRQPGLRLVHASDCAAANVCAMKADTVDAFYNVGTGRRTTIRSWRR